MFKTLPGFREFYPEDCAKKNYIFGVWRRAARSFGFSEFEPPVLEQLDLFTEKSGEEIKSQLFEFVDKGGRAVSLRPEMTPSLARMVGAKAAGIRRPVKWFAIGENYRYERQQKGRLRAFFQYNADILGEESLDADAEVIALLIESLRGFGLTENEFKLRLGDRTLWVLFLESAGVPDAKIIPVLSVIDKLEKVSPEALREMTVAALDGTGLDADALVGKIKNFISLRDLDSMRAAFDADGELAERVDARIADWRKLVSILESLGVGAFISPDLSIVRGLAYYTGFVFEAFQTVGTGRALAGGGRYDNLVKKLGYQDMPAVGFGMGDVTVSDLLELVGKSGELRDAPDAYFVIGSENVRPKALEIISALRRSGVKTDYPLKQASFGKQFKQADAVGAAKAYILGDDELAQGIVKIKDLKSGETSAVALSSLL
ncbi:MAG: histidine--tRNA ligase [Candidatus Merdousia sp.]|nr:histidine--tRNA ligase [Candidatus Merdousia sp.]